MLADERTVSDPPPRRQECDHGAVSDEASSLDCTEHLAPNGMSSVRIYIDIYLNLEILIPVGNAWTTQA